MNTLCYKSIEYQPYTTIHVEKLLYSIILNAINEQSYQIRC